MTGGVGGVEVGDDASDGDHGSASNTDNITTPLVAATAINQGIPVTTAAPHNNINNFSFNNPSAGAANTPFTDFSNGAAINNITASVLNGGSGSNSSSQRNSMSHHRSRSNASNNSVYSMSDQELRTRLIVRQTLSSQGE